MVIHLLSLPVREAAARILYQLLQAAAIIRTHFRHIAQCGARYDVKRHTQDFRKIYSEKYMSAAYTEISQDSMHINSPCRHI